jgi:ubiquinone/menaquinone biosynthesis C-methylase UbiE
MGQRRGDGFKQLQRETYDQLYDDLDFALYKVHHPFRTYFEHRIVSLALKRLHGTEQMSCLDTGCGQGVTTYVLSEHSNTVIGVDFSSGAIKTAGVFLKAMDLSNAGVLIGDVHRLGLKDFAIDIVRFEHSPHHTAEPLRAMENLGRVSREEG